MFLLKSVSMYSIPAGSVFLLACRLRIKKKILIRCSLRCCPLMDAGSVSGYQFRRTCSSLVRKFTDDEAYLEQELKHALPCEQCLALISEHMTGKLVNES